MVLALPVAFAVAGALGLVLERLLIRRFYGRPLDTLLLTFGVSLILQQLARDIFGAPNVGVTARPGSPAGSAASRTAGSSFWSWPWPVWPRSRST